MRIGKGHLYLENIEALSSLALLRPYTPGYFPLLVEEDSSDKEEKDDFNEEFFLEKTHWLMPVQVLTEARDLIKRYMTIPNYY